MATSGENNNLVHYLTTVFDDEEVRTMIQRYYIGTSRHWPGSTVFYQIDTYGNIHRGKIMQYDATSGKRVKIPFSKVTSVHSVLGMSDNLPPQCLFGEHLLSGNTDDMIAIVESEKTAIIASTWLDGGITMACGGCGNLTPSLLAPLYGRYVLLIPDNGKYEEWKDKARQMSNDFRRKSGCICITDIMERYAENEGDDIGDLILTRRDEWNRMPDNCFAMEDISGVTIL